MSGSKSRSAWRFIPRCMSRPETTQARSSAAIAYPIRFMGGKSYPMEAAETSPQIRESYGEVQGFGDLAKLIFDLANVLGAHPQQLLLRGSQRLERGIAELPALHAFAHFDVVGWIRGGQ